MSDWVVERARGSAASFHGRELGERPRPSVWVFEPERAALVLGSSQPASAVDAAAAAAAEVEVVRRHSGGGAVLLVPGEVVWVDVIVPARHPRHDDDVVRASWWLGEAWAEALASLGMAEPAVHRGGLVRSQWSGLACFAGLGPGEVTVGGRKVVGVSQRRTRAGARLQTCAHVRFEGSRTASLLALDVAARQELARQLDASVAIVQGAGGEVVESLLAALGAH